MMFITVEGPDGGGKTTQIRRLAERLADAGQPVLVTREPGGTSIGRELRRILLDADDALMPATEAFLMSADRTEHVHQVIRPALESGSIVLSDRFLDSTLAYQGGGRGLDMKLLRDMQSLATGGLVPDLTILLDLPVDEGIARKRADADMNRLDHESLVFHERVASTFRDLARENPSRWLVIDATQDVEMVHTAIWTHVSTHLEARRRALVKDGVR
jgi:dTMP kinase